MIHGPRGRLPSQLQLPTPSWPPCRLSKDSEMVGLQDKESATFTVSMSVENKGHGGIVERPETHGLCLFVCLFFSSDLTENEAWGRQNHQSVISNWSGGILQKTERSPIQMLWENNS